MTSKKALAELLQIASIYNRLGKKSKSIEILRSLVNLEKGATVPDSYTMALALYNLGEIYADSENYLIANDLQNSAAEIWGSLNLASPVDALWYSGTLAALQNETGRLIQFAQLDNENEEIA